jgi:hypothetical protein
MGWVTAADQSRDRIPVARMAEAYEAGLRVLGGYAGGGSPDKWTPRAEIDAWFAQGPDTGFAALFEIRGTEPIDSPSSGAAHARAARAAWRKLGYPDTCSIFVAVDRDVTMAQARAELTTYYRAWASVDTCLPVGYVEDDAGEILVAEGILAAVFTPAAWGWNQPPVLYTPANAPIHVCWTQERNGQLRYGGDLDMGHIRTTAPIWWRQPSNPGDGEIDMALTQADADLVAATFKRMRIDDAGPPPDDGQPVTLGQAIRASYFRDGYLANAAVPNLDNEVDALTASEGTEAATIAQLRAEVDTLHAELASLPAAIVAALPPAGESGLTAADVQAAAAAAVTGVISRTTAALSVTPAPPAQAGS